MVATSSTMLPLGTQAPDFSLLDPRSEKQVRLCEHSDQEGYLIAFICNHCPYVIHLLDHLAAHFNMWSKENIQCFAICSNDQANYPADSPQKMAELAEEKNFLFPYLHDECQQVAKLYKAACTPDFFLFDKEKELFYRGQYDSSRPGNDVKVCGSDLEQAVKNLQKGLPSPKQQIPSIGCNIKWKKGNEPSFFK
ncbi:MAG: thioredoxin family protein [Verrucomicrobia bacterium TMED40]|nr:MAG: thioredoxin family protein [Verrucomicrobia bacterium TMED40]